MDTTTTPPNAGDWFGQPRGLTFLFLTEMWEKFSFYGMRTLLVYYMIKQLRFAQGDASLLYGLYSGGVYLTPIAGGYIADRWLGRRRAVIIGGLLMALGHFTLTQEALFYPALTLIALGNGLFLPNLPSQVEDLYAANDVRRGGAYNVYYVGVNIGALLAPLVCGTLGEVYGWHWGFGAAGIGMCLGLAIFVAGGRHLPSDAGQRRSALDAAARADAARSAYATTPAVIALLLIGLGAIVFRIAYEQSGNVLAVWADTSVDRSVLGWRVPVTWMQTLNPLLVFLLTPPVVAGWRRAARRGREPRAIVKMSLGAAGMGASYLVLALAAWLADASGAPAHWSWVVLFFAIYTAAELYILPIGIGLFAGLAPHGMRATLIAAWFLSSFAGNLLSGVAGSWWGRLSPTAFFMLMAAISVASAAMLFATSPLLRRLGR